MNGPKVFYVVFILLNENLILFEWNSLIFSAPGPCVCQRMAEALLSYSEMKEYFGGSFEEYLLNSAGRWSLEDKYRNHMEY